MLRIYTDGACENNGQKNARASWGFLVIENGNVVHEDSGLVQGKQSNNTGELTAIKKAILYVIEKGEENALIYSDSKYSINSICLWNINKLINGQRKKNYELIKEIQKIFKESDCDFELIWVAGHSDHYYNDRADYLATEALTKKVHPI